MTTITKRPFLKLHQLSDIFLKNNPCQSTLKDFLRTGKSSFTCDEYNVIHDKEGHPVIVYDGFCITPTSHQAKIDLKKDKRFVIDELIFIKNNSKRENKYMVLFNGDGNNWEHNYIHSVPDSYRFSKLLEDEINKFDSATLSFECLIKFFPKIKKNFQLMSKLIDQSLVIVDFVPDIRSIIIVDKNVVKDLKKWIYLDPSRQRLKQCPIEVPTGFTVMELQGTKALLHRSASVLIYDKDNKRTILMGQDEGSYFGCQLKDNPKTLKLAYQSLIPKEIRNKKNLLRQGEWFAVPVDSKIIPNMKDCVFEYKNNSYAADIHLPRETSNSNSHYLSGSGEILISKKGEIFIKNFVIDHDQHASLTLTKNIWYQFYKNTAVTSYSQEGVD